MTARLRLASTSQAAPKVPNSTAAPFLDGDQFIHGLARLLARRLARKIREGHSPTARAAPVDSLVKAPPKE